MERTLTLFENGTPIFALKLRVDSRNNNLEEYIANFIMQLGNDKGMINPMRVANRVRILSNRHSGMDVLSVLRHPDDWRINETRPLPEDEQLKIEEKSIKTKQALENAGMS